MIIAHRGASWSLPENTLAAVQHAWNNDADAVEVDVRLTQDNRIMLMHDASTRRTTGADHIMEMTSSQTLLKIDAGSWKSSKYSGECIPLLEDVIRSIPNGKRLFIEIKSDASILPLLIPMLNPEYTTVIGFNFDVIAQCKTEMEDINVLWLYEPGRRLLIGPRIKMNESILEKAKLAGLTGIDLQHHVITHDTCKEAHDYGLSLYAWTVDDVRTAQRLIEWGVDGITTNRPEIMKQAGL